MQPFRVPLHCQTVLDCGKLKGFQDAIRSISRWFQVIRQAADALVVLAIDLNFSVRENF